MGKRKKSKVKDNVPVSSNSSNDSEYKKLRKWNVIAGVFHLIIATGILYFSTDFALPLVTNYLKFDELSQRHITDTQTVAEVKFAYAVALFSIFSAMAHFTISLPGVYEWYVKNLKRRINFARWYEYAFSSSLMVVLIAMLAGMYDLSSVILIFFVNMAMIILGLMMELHNQTTSKTDWTSYIWGCVFGAVPWVVISLYLIGAGGGENGTPDFVYYIFFSLFLFFNSFALNMYLQYKEVGKWSDYLFGEKVYIVLSFIAKSALALQVFAGTLRPE